MSIADQRAAAERALADPRVVAFLQSVVRPPESGYGPGGYGLQYGDTSPSITDFSQHPPARNGYSAAGAYSFVLGTWNWLAPQVGVTDFSPHSQDLVAVQLLTVVGALPYIFANDIPGAISKANGINAWSSLPGGANSRGRTLESALSAYNAAVGGSAPLAGSAGILPAAVPPAAPIDQSTLLIIGAGLFLILLLR